MSEYLWKDIRLPQCWFYGNLIRYNTCSHFPSTRIVPPEKVEPYLEVHGNEITVKDLPLYYSYPDTDEVYVKGERTLTYHNGTLSDEFSKYKLTDKEDKFYRQIIQESNN